jgi:hypothetical protein
VDLFSQRIEHFLEKSAQKGFLEKSLPKTTHLNKACQKGLFIKEFCALFSKKCVGNLNPLFLSYQ